MLKKVADAFIRFFVDWFWYFIAFNFYVIKIGLPIMVIFGLIVGFIGFMRTWAWFLKTHEEEIRQIGKFCGCD